MSRLIKAVERRLQKVGDNNLKTRREYVIYDQQRRIYKDDMKLTITNWLWESKGYIITPQSIDGIVKTNRSPVIHIDKFLRAISLLEPICKYELGYNNSWSLNFKGKVDIIGSVQDELGIVIEPLGKDIKIVVPHKSSMVKYEDFQYEYNDIVEWYFKYKEVKEEWVTIHGNEDGIELSM